MYSGPSGFYKAPVAKVFLGVVAASSLLALSSPDTRRRWDLSFQPLFVEWQLWRLLPASLAFGSIPELLFGAYLLYFFRLFERQLGSSRYAVFLLFSHLGSSALQAAFLYALGPQHGSEADSLEDPLTPAAASWLSPYAALAPGPYGVLFASFVLYVADVPSTARFTLFSQLQFTDKTLLYLAGLQLLLSSWAQSVVPGLCGVCVGLLFRANVLGIRTAQVPAPLVGFMAHYFSFVLSQPPAAAPSGRAGPQRTPGEAGGGANAPAGAPGRAPGFAGTGRPQVPGGLPAWAQAGLAGVAVPPELQRGASTFAAAGPPPQAAVDELLAMGFDRQAALRALAQARNDLTVATNLLLESQHSG